MLLRPPPLPLITAQSIVIVDCVCLSAIISGNTHPILTVVKFHGISRLSEQVASGRSWNRYNSDEFLQGVGVGGSLRLQTPVIGSRLPCLFTPHILTWRHPCKWPPLFIGTRVSYYTTTVTLHFLLLNVYVSAYFHKTDNHGRASQTVKQRHKLFIRKPL